MCAYILQTAKMLTKVTVKCTAIIAANLFSGSMSASYNKCGLHSKMGHLPFLSTWCFLLLAAIWWMQDEFLWRTIKML